MNLSLKRLFIGGFALVLLLSISTIAQRKPTRPAPPRYPIFAVLNDGKTIEPIAFIEGKRIRSAISGSDDQRNIITFGRNYYKPGANYRLVFGGANAGLVRVIKNDPRAECTATKAEVATSGNRTPLKGLVMGLATSAPMSKNRISYRRRPTASEREEIETLVRAELAKVKVTGKSLKYHNLTALDIDDDGKAEMVGSYWVDLTKDSRGLLFFVATVGTAGKYTIGFKDYRDYDVSKIMSGEISSVDQGVYHELLLDVFDVDGDGVAEIFTYTQGFEGAGFAVYKKNVNRFDRIFEGSNYHCGF